MISFFLFLIKKQRFLGTAKHLNLSPCNIYLYSYSLINYISRYNPVDHPFASFKFLPTHLWERPLNTNNLKAVHNVVLLCPLAYPLAYCKKVSLCVSAIN